MAVPIGSWPSGQWRFYNENGYEWQYTELDDEVGVPGQGVADPISWFENHGLLLVNGTYYDPSYGRTYTGPGDFEQQAVAGYYRSYAARTYDETVVGADLNGDEEADDTAVTINLFGVNKGTAVFDIAFVEL